MAVFHKVSFLLTLAVVALTLGKHHICPTPYLRHFKKVAATTPSCTCRMLWFTAIESAILLLGITGVRKTLPPWGPPLITQSARSITKWIVCVLCPNINTKVPKKIRNCLLFVACMTGAN